MKIVWVSLWSIMLVVGGGCRWGSTPESRAFGVKSTKERIGLILQEQRGTLELFALQDQIHDELLKRVGVREAICALHWENMEVEHVDTEGRRRGTEVRQTLAFYVVLSVEEEATWNGDGVAVLVRECLSGAGLTVETAFTPDEAGNEWAVNGIVARK